MKHLTTFDSFTDYSNNITNFPVPNISFNSVKEEVIWGDEHYYSNQYFTFVALENCVFTLTIPSNVGTSCVTSVSYSINNGETWVTTNNSSSVVTITTPTITKGNKVIWKGIGVRYSNYGASPNRFNSTGRFNVYGNIMSLLYGDKFKNNNTLTSDYAFSYLFYNTTKLVSVKNLILPAISLTQYCYLGMFNYCSSLIDSPKLPATTLNTQCYAYMFCYCSALVNAPKLPATTAAHSCYERMFQCCSSLVNAPKLPATTLNEYCYHEMFRGCTSLLNIDILPADRIYEYSYNGMFFECTSLVKAPIILAKNLQGSYCCAYMFSGCTKLKYAPTILQATTLQSYCYQNMFYGCTSLTTAPVLPATTLSVHCYLNMFRGCASLVNAPELPSITLAEDCYGSMFENCTSLVNAPYLPATSLEDYCYCAMFRGCSSLTNVQSILPATTLQLGCYRYMFKNCTSLITAPELPALQLAEYCYRHMFYGCSSLNYIKALFINVSTQNDSVAIERWVEGVASSGTFVKNGNATWNTGVAPSNWTIETYSRDPIYGMYVDDILLCEQLNNAKNSTRPINNIPSDGSNLYIYTRNQMQYDNMTTYIWESINEAGEPYYMLTTTVDYSLLIEDSLDYYDYEIYPQHSQYIKAFLNDDESEAYGKNSNYTKSKVITAVTQYNGNIYMWVDDYDQEQIDAALDDWDASGANLYWYYGDTMEYDGDTYYVWEADNSNENPLVYLLTDTDDISELQSQSIDYTGNYSVEFNSLIVRLSEDSELEYVNNGDQCLIYAFEY